MTRLKHKRPFLFVFFFGILLFTLVCKVLQTSCSQRPLIRQRTFTLWFSCFLSLSFLCPFPFPFPFPYPLPIADAVALTVAVAMRCLSVHCELWTRQGNKSRSVICREAQRDVVVVFDYVWLTEKCENTSVGKRFEYTYCTVAYRTHVPISKYESIFIVATLTLRSESATSEKCD